MSEHDALTIRLWRSRPNRWIARLEASTLGDPEGYGELPDEALRNLASDWTVDDFAALARLRGERRTDG